MAQGFVVPAAALLHAHPEACHDSEEDTWQSEIDSFKQHQDIKQQIKGYHSFGAWAQLEWKNWTRHQRKEQIGIKKSIIRPLKVRHFYPVPNEG